MNKFFGLFVALLILFTTPVFAQTVSMQTVVDFLFENGMTKFDTVSEFNANARITRGETAKFIAQYAEAINYNGSYDGSCTFSDIAGYDYTLIPHIDTVCKFGLIKWSQWMYSPNAQLTEAEAATILGRSQTGFEDETGVRWYQGYFDRALALWLVSSSEIDSVATTPITRWRLGLWIYTIMNPWVIDTTNESINEVGDDTLEWILDDIFGEEEAAEPRTVGSTMNVNEAEIQSEPKQRTIGATMNVTEAGETRRDGFQPYSRSQLQNALNNDTTVVLYFSAEWCPSCQLLTSSLERDQFAFPEDLLVLSVDFDYDTELVSQYGVTRQHTTIVLDTEWNERKRSVWTIYSLEELEEEVNAM